MSKRNLRYYLGLSYAIEIRKIRKKEGGGYTVTIPELSSDAFVSHGETIEEAVDRLEKLKKIILKEWISKGLSIPEPSDDYEYSGKFVVRIPKYLHKKYAEHAKKQNISLNTAVHIALDNYMYADNLVKIVESKLSICIEPIVMQLERLKRIPFYIAKKTTIVEPTSEEKLAKTA